MELKKKNTFLQFHVLTAYPTSNLNRDESGMPKSVKFGSVTRGRVSSQCNKYWYRDSDIFDIFKNSERKSLPTRIFVPEKFAPKLEELGLQDDEIKIWASDVYNLLGGKIQSEEDSDSEEENLDEGEIEEIKGKWTEFAHKQVIVITAGEVKALNRIAEEIAAHVKKEKSHEYIGKVIEARKKAKGKKEKEDKNETKKKRKSQAKKNPSADKLKEQFDAYVKDYPRSVDVSLFGRMSASHPDWDIEAACQVAHSISVHPVSNEVDYFTAVDALNKRGAAFIGPSGFNSAVYYLYVCLDIKTLLGNLENTGLSIHSNKNSKLAKEVVEALIYCLTTVSPGGKQNSFASRAFASYVLAEKGSVQPRSLAAAFLEPVKGERILPKAIEVLSKVKNDFDSAYHFSKPEEFVFDVHNGKNKTEGLIKFCIDIPEFK